MDLICTLLNEEDIRTQRCVLPTPWIENLLPKSSERYLNLFDCLSVLARATRVPFTLSILWIPPQEKGHSSFPLLELLRKIPCI